MKDDELRVRFNAWWSAYPVSDFSGIDASDVWAAWQACHAEMQGEDVRRDGATQNWIELNTKAQSKVESSVLWERFIDGTPLSNDIACWMADFAIEAIDTAMGERHELS